MKNSLYALLLISVCFFVACASEPKVPRKSEAKFLDVDVTFTHPKIKPIAGQILHGCLYYTSTVGQVPLTTKADLTTDVELTADQIANGVRLTFEPVARANDAIYVFLWIDIDGNGSLNEGDLAMYGDIAAENVEKGESPTNYIGEYNVKLKMSMGYGEGNFVVPDGMAADYDRNLYNIVVVGPQLWLKENLRTTYYNDGTAIPTASGSEFSALSTAAYVNPYSDSESVEKYGLLYNWYAATTKNPCPEGYRIPSDADMLVLEKFLSPSSTDLGDALSDATEANVWRATSDALGTKLKSADYSFEGTNNFGLSFVPGGIYASSLAKDASASTKISVIWLSDVCPSNSGKAMRRMLQNNVAGIGRGADTKAKGQSLRCMRDNPDYKAPVLTKLTAPVISVSGSLVSWSAVSNASSYAVKIDDVAISSPEIAETNGTCSFDVAKVCAAATTEKTYKIVVIAAGDNVNYLDSDASNAVNVTIAAAVTPSTEVKDYDGNVYTTATIGNQVWLKENLRATHFNDGSAIAELSGDNFAAATSAAYVTPYTLAADVVKYGLLYNWYVVGTEGKNPCPTGYHIPSDSEFITLEKYIEPTTDFGTGPDDAPAANVYRGTTVGTKLKTTEYSFGGTNDYGLAITPGGIYATSLAKDASATTKICVIWTTDSYPTADTKAIRRFFQHDKAGIGRGSDTKVKGHTLRCLKDSK